MREVLFVINGLLFSDRQNVTSVAQKLTSIFSIPDSTIGRVKTIVISNLSGDSIFFGVDASVTITNGGGLLVTGASREFPLYDLNASPYFITATTAEIGIEVWG